MQNMWKNRAHVVMALPAFLVLFFIMYVPMAGLVMAFKAFDYSKGIFGSPWNGVENFKFLLASKSTFFNMTKNTVLYYLLFTSVGTVLNVALAIAIDNLVLKRMAKTMQTLMIIPVFISYAAVQFIVYAFIGQVKSKCDHLDCLVCNAGMTIRKSFTETRDEDWDKMREMWRAEKIRGAETLYWEDVNVGDQPQSLCTGPITEMDMIRYHGLQVIEGRPMRDNLLDPDMVRRLEPFKNKYNVYYLDYASHYCGQGVGNNPIFYNTTNRNLLIRVVTNWMGDDGWLRSIDWHFSNTEADSFFEKVPFMKGKAATNHGSCGQCMLLHGYVTDKYINDAGEHLVDLTCWAETWDHKLTQVIGTSVVLPSRG